MTGDENVNRMWRIVQAAQEIQGDANRILQPQERRLVEEDPANLLDDAVVQGDADMAQVTSDEARLLSLLHEWYPALAPIGIAEVLMSMRDRARMESRLIGLLRVNYPALSLEGIYEELSRLFIAVGETEEEDAANAESIAEYQQALYAGELGDTEIDEYGDVVDHDEEANAALETASRLEHWASFGEELPREEPVKLYLVGSADQGRELVAAHSEEEAVGICIVAGYEEVGEVQVQVIGAAIAGTDCGFILEERISE